MPLWVSFCLGLLQGFTEFIPISSSGHLKLAQTLAGSGHPLSWRFFDILCHLATLFPLLWIARHHLLPLFASQRRKIAFSLFYGLLPLLLVPFLKGVLNQVYGLPLAMALSFIGGGCYMLFADRNRPSSPSPLPPERWASWRSLGIGAVQLLALLPGLSRSGATISTARLMGWNREGAVAFSYLLAIPTILGGLIYESWEWSREGYPVEPGWLPCLVGFATALVVSSLLIRALLRLVIRKGMAPFAYYSIFLGVVVGLLTLFSAPTIEQKPLSLEVEELP